MKGRTKGETPSPLGSQAFEMLSHLGKCRVPDSSSLWDCHRLAGISGQRGHGVDWSPSLILEHENEQEEEVT